MTSSSSTVLLFHNTMRVDDGHLAEYRRAIEEAVAFTREHAPQTMVEVFLDEERMSAHSFQLYPDSAAVLTHWRLSDPYIQEVNEHGTVVDFEVFGDPDERVRSGLTEALGGRAPRIHPRIAGFSHLSRAG